MTTEFRGLNHYVDSTAAEMSIRDDTAVQPVGLARRNRALQLIEHQITGAGRAPDPAQRPAVLDHAGDLLRSLELSLRAGVKMVRDGYEMFGHEPPAWLGEFAGLALPAVAGAAPEDGEEPPQPGAAPEDGEEPPQPGGTGEGHDPHVAGTVSPRGEPTLKPVDPNPLNPAADPPIFHPTEGIDYDNPAAGTVDSQTQIDVPPESRAPRNTGLDRPRPSDEESARRTSDQPPKPTEELQAGRSQQATDGTDPLLAAGPDAGEMPPPADVEDPPKRGRRK